MRVLLAVVLLTRSFVVLVLAVVESGQDEGSAKTNPSLTREGDLTVNISDLDNIFDEDDDELGVRMVKKCCVPLWYVQYITPTIHLSTN